MCLEKLRLRKCQSVPAWLRDEGDAVMEAQENVAETKPTRVCDSHWVQEAEKELAQAQQCLAKTLEAARSYAETAQHLALIEHVLTFPRDAWDLMDGDAYGFDRSETTVRTNFGRRVLSVCMALHVVTDANQKLASAEAQAEEMIDEGWQWGTPVQCA